MNDICDIYLPNSVQSSEFRFIRIFDKNFLYEEEKTYSGYIGVSIDRIKVIHLLVQMRSKGITLYSVPIIYRIEKNIEKKLAFNLAMQYANKQGFDVTIQSTRTTNLIPLFWSFEIINNPIEKAGGIVMIDKVDGHVWSFLDYEKYMYDYNNILI